MSRSRRRSCYTALVEEAVSVGSLVHLMSFEGASAHLLEVTLADELPACGMSIAELGLPRESAIVAIVRREHMIIPDPETLLYAGDEVIVLAMVESERAIQAILVGDAAPSGPVSHARITGSCGAPRTIL